MKILKFLGIQPNSMCIFFKIKTIAIIAEGIPENKTKKLNKLARDQGVTIIGPATVGGIKPGCFKIGNTGGMLDNILDSKEPFMFLELFRYDYVIEYFFL